ncbi:MAG TPA: ethanolamine permease [Bryobacteraceae bacterium]|jgi:ethanolamine permease|nr:ethanolamine permease [Bryobacteraceae bacterium]
MPEQGPDQGSVSYTRADGEYFEKRGLRRHARVLHLWALGVGGVISGDFFGWNFGLVAGGSVGMFVALAIMTVMYAGLCFSIAEMSPALPHTGGAYSFGRTAMGPWGGYITGLAENMEYILTPAVIVVGIGGYLGAIFGTPKSAEPLWWLASYAVFVALNVYGVELSFRVSVVITLIALAVLVVFWIAAIPRMDFARYALDVVPRAGNSKWFPGGTAGVLAQLPFALWFYLAIEQLPLAAEESHDPKRDMPRGLIYGLGTLVLVSFFTLGASVSIAPGATKLATSNEPLLLDFQTLFATTGAKVLGLIACTGLIASFHTIIFAYGRQIFSLSRAGYFPQWLSETHPRHKTPVRALIAGSALGFAAAYAIYLSGEKGTVGAMLLNMAVFGAVVAYILQMASFIVLRWKLPSIERPYRSPLGVTGAVIAALIAAVTLVMLFFAPEYNRGVLGAAAWFLAGVAYFAFYARRRLILSPEEEFAMSHITETHKKT